MRHWLPMIAFMATVTLCGCVGMVDSVSEFLHAGPGWEAAQDGDIGSRARELEAHGELTMALDHWRLVQRIAIDQAEASRETTRLEKKIDDAVQSHHQNGLAALRKRELEAARNHFLAALRLDPTFQPALKQIKACFSPFPMAVYLAESGDHPASVAKKVFGDEGKAFLVAWFNDLPEDDVLIPGSLLILPKIEKAPLKKVRIKKPPLRLAEAGARLAKNDFDGALILAEQANSANPDVQALIYTIHLKKTTAQIESGLFEEARQSLAKIPSGFAGKDAVLQALQVAVKNQQMAAVMADAREHFNQKHYQQSLDLVEGLLKNAPDSVDAHDLASEARYRLALDHLNHKRFLKARQALDQADEGHAASMTLKKTVHTGLMELSQMHYRNGVKHFINEDLKSAIAEWESALACNPDHGKARENIENTRRLMQKIETMP